MQLTRIQSVWCRGAAQFKLRVRDITYGSDQEPQLAAARSLVEDVARHLDIDASVELWDGSRVPLGREVKSDLRLKIASPGTIASLVRWPTLDRIIRHYAQGNIGLEGGTLIDLGRKVGTPAVRQDQLRPCAVRHQVQLNAGQIRADPLEQCQQERRRDASALAVGGISIASQPC